MYSANAALAHSKTVGERPATSRAAAVASSPDAAAPRKRAATDTASLSSATGSAGTCSRGSVVVEPWVLTTGLPSGPTAATWVTGGPERSGTSGASVSFVPLAVRSAQAAPTTVEEGDHRPDDGEEADAAARPDGTAAIPAGAVGADDARGGEADMVVARCVDAL